MGMPINQAHMYVHLREMLTIHCVQWRCGHVASSVAMATGMQLYKFSNNCSIKKCYKAKQSSRMHVG